MVAPFNSHSKGLPPSFEILKETVFSSLALRDSDISPGSYAKLGAITAVPFTDRLYGVCPFSFVIMSAEDSKVPAAVGSK